MVKIVPNNLWKANDAGDEDGQEHEIEKNINAGERDRRNGPFP